MTKILKYIPVIAAIMLGSCSDMQPAGPGVDRTLTLVLNISDIEAQSRALYSTPQAISTLRVLICRPDGNVEINRLIEPGSDAIDASSLRFIIADDAYKMVYLVANEATTGHSFDDATFFDPGALEAPDAFSGSPLNLTTERLPTSASDVPMTAVYRLGTDLSLANKVGASDFEIRYTLSLLRTVTKFTFNIKNLRNIPVSISEIGVNLISADRYYLFPHVLSAQGHEVIHYLTAEGSLTEESGTGLTPVDESGALTTSPFSEHFRINFKAAATATAPHRFTGSPLIIPAGNEDTVLEYYYYESNLAPVSVTDKPYTLYIDFDNNRYTTPLDNLPTLPRNTHVVVNMQFNNNDKTLDIDVLPYYGVELNPGFGQL